jgi:flavin reductase (DIM6/NTAB) family NADH-FMN oxidoreductase RutF
VEYSFSGTEEGLPVLDNSMVFLGCQVIGTHVYGDHTIYLGEVKEIHRNDSGVPLMFYQSRWYDPAKG